RQPKQPESLQAALRGPVPERRQRPELQHSARQLHSPDGIGPSPEEQAAVRQTSAEPSGPCVPCQTRRFHSPSKTQPALAAVADPLPPSTTPVLPDQKQTTFLRSFYSSIQT